MKGAPAELIALLNDAEVGRLEADAQGRMRFVYENDWRTDPNAYPLSISMPLTKGEHAHDVVSAYLWGLLPDNEIIIEAWAKRFKVSARDPLALLANVGEDCPGAVRFVRPAGRGRLSREGDGAVDWLDDPGASSIAALLRERSRHPSEDLDTLIDALAFNWAIAGTDAHAKNYSVLIGRGGEIRLAPLYDLASYLPYAGHEIRRLKLAMKIGGKYRLREIGVYQWTKLARELSRDPDEVTGRVATLCAALPDRTADVLRSSRADGLVHASLAPLAAQIQERARSCARMFE